MENLTKEKVLKNISENELFCLIGGFLERVRDKGLFNVKPKNLDKELIITDKERIQIIREYLKSYS